MSTFGKRYTGTLMRVERVSDLVSCCELCQVTEGCLFFNHRGSNGDCDLLKEVCGLPHPGALS